MIRISVQIILVTFLVEYIPGKREKHFFLQNFVDCKLPGVPGIVTFIYKNIEPLILKGSLALSVQFKR